MGFLFYRWRTNCCCPFYLCLRAIVAARASIFCRLSVVRASANPGFSETHLWIQTKCYGMSAIHHISGQFLALLDYVRTAHGMESLSVIRRKSHICTPVSQLSQNLLSSFLSNFSSRLPWGWTRVIMDTFEKKPCIFWFLCEFFNFASTLDSMGTKTLHLLQIALELF